MAEHEILVFSDGPDAGQLAEAIRKGAPNCRLVTPDDLERHPDWRDRVEVMLSRAKIDPAQWPALRWVQTSGAGIAPHLLESLRGTDVRIVNARGVAGEPIAEQALAMMLMFVRRMPQVCARKSWEARQAARGADVLSGKTLGVLGLGAIGLRLAELVRVFPMRVIAVRRHPAPVDWIDWVGGAADLPRLLAESDFLFNVLPLTEETRGLIGEVQFRAMKPGAIYINYGRGATTDTAALLRALREGWIGGAGLDVVDPEPLPADHPLWTMDNVVLTPHYGGSRADSFERKSAILIENLRRHSKGEALMNVIDKTLGY